MAKAKSPSAKPASRAAKTAALGPGSPLDTGAAITRPTSLAEIIGHQHAIGQLRSGIAADRLHHALIFFGPKGVGKFTAALAFAAELLTPKSTPDPDLIRALLGKGGHADLHVITKELAAVCREDTVRRSKQVTIAKDVIDEFLLEPADKSRAIASDSLASKVFIVDEAELLDRSLTNAPTQASMLKTLEEPPPGTIIILITTDESRLLPTIRSRCQRIGFGRLSTEEVAAVLKARGQHIAGAEGQWLLDTCDGSPGAAIMAIKAGLFGWHQRLGPMLLAVEREPLSAPALGHTMAGLVEDRAAATVAEGGKGTSKEAANRHWTKVMLGYIAAHQRSRLMGDSSAYVKIDAARIINLCLQAEEYLLNNVQHATIFENLGAQIASGEALLV